MGFIDYEVDGAVGIITINRPKALNALNEDVLNELEQAFDAVDLSVVRCLILTGQARSRSLQAQTSVL